MAESHLFIASTGNFLNTEIYSVIPLVQKSTGKSIALHENLAIL